MKQIFKYWNTVLLSTILVFLMCCCSNEVNNPPDDTPPQNFFPSNIGTNYTYKVVNDSASVFDNGTRISIYTGDTTVSNVDYTIQSDDLTVGTSTIIAKSFFRKTNVGVFYFADTTGFTDFIPDTLVQFLSTPLESQALLFPLLPGSFWTVYRITISSQQVNFDPLRVGGAFEGIETLTLNLYSGDTDVEATKVKYTFTLQQNPQQLPQNFIAYAWLTEDIGMVKFEGKALLINLLVGNIDFSDTTTTTTHSLVDFEIK
ncbi:MAG: hypothetical protein JSW63_08550 [Ignavibacterium sp.]|nr:MAG: hypothetical protein JSW63_08550 [Ignavibacterium sp.]